MQNTEANLAIKNCCFIDEGDALVIKFHGDDWKWYDGYKKVDALNALYNHFSRADNTLFRGAFARTGEDSEDVVTKNFGDDPYDLEQVCRSIESLYQYDESKLGFNISEPA
jgi:hypothetical protein